MSTIILIILLAGFVYGVIQTYREDDRPQAFVQTHLTPQHIIQPLSKENFNA